MGNATEEVVSLMPIIKFLKDFYRYHDGYYSKIYFVRYMEPIDEYILISNIYLRICGIILGVSSDGYIDILGLNSEEQEVLKRELAKYRFG